MVTTRKHPSPPQVPPQQAPPPKTPEPVLEPSGSPPSDVQVINVPVLEHDSVTKSFLSKNMTTAEAWIGTLTPALASFLWHNLNTRNRDLRLPSETAYELDQGSGRWIGPTTDAIGLAFVKGDEEDLHGKLDDTAGLAVDHKGRLILGKVVKSGQRVVLINGQHRCAACARSGKTIGVIFAIGLPLAAREVTDGGLPRQTKDQLVIGGMSKTEAPRMDAVIKAIDFYLTRQRAKWTIPGLKSYIKAWEFELSWLEGHVPKHRLYGDAKIAAGFAIAVRALRAAAMDLAALEKIARDLREGSGLDADSPIHMFREFCASMPTSSSKKKRNAGVSLPKRTLNAIYYEINGEKMNSPKKGTYPERDDGSSYFLGLIEGT